jgi:hypothetical protein
MRSVSCGLRATALRAAPRQEAWRTLCRTAVAKADAVPLPLDYYKLLQVNRASSRDLVRRSYERIAKAPAPGYSEDALYSRAVLLKAACDALSDPDSRRAYDQQLFKEQKQ